MNHVKIESPIARIPRRLAFWAAAATALLVSHDAVFLIQLGPGEALVRALREAGHAYWGAASLGIALLAIAGGIVAGARVSSLRRRARALGADPIKRPGGLGRRWIGAWAPLLATVAIGFLVQENVEHFIGHNHAPGLGALMGPEYPLALPIIGLITAFAALMLAAIRHVEHVLFASIAVALRRFTTRPPRAMLRPPLRVAVPAASPMAGARAGRAPPRWLVSAT
jgi:hypothetical protein